MASCMAVSSGGGVEGAGTGCAISGKFSAKYADIGVGGSLTGEDGNNKSSGIRPGSAVVAEDGPPELTAGS